MYPMLAVKKHPSIVDCWYIYGFTDEVSFAKKYPSYLWMDMKFHSSLGGFP